jgi:two-component sensor histidine kinase
LLPKKPCFVRYTSFNDSDKMDANRRERAGRLSCNAVSKMSSKAIASPEIWKRSPAMGYALAIAAFALTFIVREGLGAWLQGHLGLVSFIPAVLLVTYFVGLGPGILTGAASIAAVWYFFIPRFSPLELAPSGGVAFGMFACGVVVSIVVVNRLRVTNYQTTTDLAALRRLHELSFALVRTGKEFKEALGAAVRTAIDLSRADKGNLQLLDTTSGALTIVAHEGFDPPFLKFFEQVPDDGSARAAAMRSNNRVIVEDVANSEIFAGQPSLKVMLDAEARAVISTPLMSSRGNLLGMISVHFREPHRPTEPELTALDLLARQTADYLERKRAEELEDTLLRELQHRSNNLLAVIQSIAHRTLSTSQTLEEANKAFEGRLQALARSNRHLTRPNWSKVTLREVISEEVSSFPMRTSFEGSKIELNAQHAQKFALVVHELMTNAVKYGALSDPKGKVKVSWSVKRDGAGPVLSFRWEESGGPHVSEPTKQGFGSQLIRTTFSDGRADYCPKGLIYEIDVPLAAVSADTAWRDEQEPRLASAHIHREAGL